MAIYLHEIITIDKGGKEGYLETFRSEWVPYAEESRGMKLVWIGSTIGSTAHWPETMAVWELRDWNHYAEVCDRMYTESTGDERLKRWWQDAFRYRERSHTQTLIGASFSPTLNQLLARGVSGTAFAFSSFRVTAGCVDRFLATLEGRVPFDREHGRELVGAYEVAFTNDRAYAIWVHRGLVEITRYEAQVVRDPRYDEWHRTLDGVLKEAVEFWGFATPYCPLWPRDYKTETRVW